VLDLFKTQASPKEVWQPVPGYEGYCEASSFGRVRSLPRDVRFVRDGAARVRRINGKVLSQTVDRGRHAYGRLQVKLVGPAGPKTHLVHRVVAAAFFGPCPSGHEVAHNDGNPKNNRVENLRYATPAENTRDKFRHGTVLSGELVGNSKLTTQAVLAIRSRRASGERVSDLSSAFGVSEAQVSRICSGTRWAGVSL
jgi:hypothetical protein